MGIFGAIFGGSGGGGGGGSTVLAIATTAESIRDRAIEVIEALTLRSLGAGVGNALRHYLNEGTGDFVVWALGNPAGAFRRFQVRVTLDGDGPPTVSNTDFEERRVLLAVRVAYPQSSRTGGQDALDRDDVIDEDYKTINYAVGIYGRAHFSPPFPDAMPTGATKAIVRAAGVDFLVIDATFTYQAKTS